MNCRAINIAIILIANCNLLKKSAIDKEITLIMNVLPARYLSGVTGNSRSNEKKLSNSHALNKRKATPENATITARLKRSESS
jgi:hypothetical protein